MGETCGEEQAAVAGEDDDGAVEGGGRYDGLIEQLGGPATPAVGVAFGLERLALLTGATAPMQRPKVYLAAADEVAKEVVVSIATRLRHDGVWAEYDTRLGSLKSQMKRADKVGAEFAIVLGEREIAAGRVGLKPMAGGDLVEVSIEDIAGKLRAS